MDGKEAIKMLCTIQRTIYLGNRKFDEAIDVAIKALGQPTIEPERTGKWIKEKSRGQLYQCSACNNYLDFRGVNAGRGSANFCPNCGARMEP